MKKARGRKKKKNKKENTTMEEDISNQNSQQVIDIKQNDQFVRQHVRPDFLKRWDGESNSL